MAWRIRPLQTLSEFVQIVFALLISRYWFRESIRAIELAGIGLSLVGVLMFRLV